jgi:hypothetical protein
LRDCAREPVDEHDRCCRSSGKTRDLRAEPTSVLSDGLAAVEAACQEALNEGVHSANVVINILARRRQPAPPPAIATPEALRRHAPVADCARYDNFRRAGCWNDLGSYPP